MIPGAGARGLEPAGGVEPGAGRSPGRAIRLWAFLLASAHLTLSAPQGAAAQELPAPAAEAVLADTIELVDRIVAVVGDTAILWSEVIESLTQMKAQGMGVPEYGTPAFDTLAAETLGGLVDQLVLLQQAVQAQVSITPEMLDAETDRRFREIRNSFPTAVAFQDAVARSGRTLVQYRELLRSQVRAQLLVESFVQQNRSSLPPVSVSEEEIRSWFDENLSGETRPATISFEQLVLEPSPSQAASDSARAVVEEALAELRGGGDFQIVARRYSVDFANRDQGGDLGWVRRSQLVPAFAEAAWASRTGQPIGPVRTRFGFHIIKVENARAGERKIRHILVRPVMTEADYQRAFGLAETLADSIRGGRNVSELAERHGVREIPVRIMDVPMDQVEPRLGRAYAEALQDRLPGQVVGPFATEGLLPDVPAYVVVRVTSFQAQGPYELADVREEIRSRVLFEKGYERFIQELKNEVHVEIRL